MADVMPLLESFDPVHGWVIDLTGDAVGAVANAGTGGIAGPLVSELVKAGLQVGWDAIKGQVIQYFVNEVDSRVKSSLKKVGHAADSVRRVPGVLLEQAERLTEMFRRDPDKFPNLLSKFVLKKRPYSEYPGYTARSVRAGKYVPVKRRLFRPFRRFNAKVRRMPVKRGRYRFRRLFNKRM